MPRGPEFQKERGEEQRRRILAKLADGPLSARELAAKIHLTHSAICLHIRRLRKDKLIHIAGHRMQHRAREIPLFAIGDAPDAKYIRVKQIKKPCSHEAQREKVREMILSQLRIAKATGPELAILLDMANPTLRKYLPQMRNQGLIYRAKWVAKDGGGIHVAVWAVGNKKDAPMPKAAEKRKLPNLPVEQLEAINRKQEVKAIIRSAKQKPFGIFGPLGL